jgi:hypothetical protein
METNMESHMDGEVKWVRFLTSLMICLIVTGIATAGG